MLPLYELPGHLIRRLHQISMSAFASEMTALGLDMTSVQYAALVVLRERSGIDQATLAGLIAYDRVTIGGVIARIEARGWVERTVSETDRRARCLKLTPKGAALLDRTSDAVLRAQDVMLKGLTPEERHALIALLRKATDAGNEISRAPFRPFDTCDEPTGFR